MAFTAKVDATEVVAGGQIQVEFELKNADAKRFEPPTFSPLKVLQGPMTTTGMSIINGTVTKKQGWVYVLRVPATTGTYTLGAATAFVGRQSLRSQPLQIRVVNAGANHSQPQLGQQAAGNEVFVTAEPSTRTPYAGQQVTVQYCLYTRLPVEGFDLVEVPTYKGFFSQDKRRFDTRVTTVSVGGKDYATRILHEVALFPQQTGELTLEPVGFRLGIEQAGIGGLFGAPPVTMRTQPVTLKVKPLPEPVPADFSGGVGQYVWEVQADRTQFSTDEALVLRIAWRGNGDGRRFTLPKPAMPDGLEIYDPTVTAEEEYENGVHYVHSKNQEYTVLAKQSGSYTLNPALTVFDPDSNRYVTLHAAQPIYLTVTPGTHTNAVAPLDRPDDDHTVGSWWLFVQENWWWMLLIPSILALLWVLLRPKSTTPPTEEATPAPVSMPPPAPKVAPPAAIPVPLPPVPDATEELLSLAVQPDARPFYQALARHLQQSLSARAGLTSAQWSKGEVQRVLTEKGATEDMLTEVGNLLDACEAAIYGGIVAPVDERPQLVTRTNAVLQTPLSGIAGGVDDAKHGA